MRVRAGVLAALLPFAWACAHSSQTRSTSLVDYLYPSGGKAAFEPAVPHLRLPLRVGVAFVPQGHEARSHPDAAGALTEQQKIDLLRHVAERFAEEPTVDAIEIIPSAYLRPQGGFANLDQLQRLYALDLIALVSYDQAQFTDQGWDSLSYWTGVAVYVVPAERNATHTLLDAAVFHIASRKLLFRAPGTSMVSGRATRVNLSEQLREDAARGFDEAAEDLAGNLDTALIEFRERVETRPEEVRVSRRGGGAYSGNGGFPLLLLAASLAAAAWSVRPRPSIAPAARSVRRRPSIAPAARSVRPRPSIAPAARSCRS
ncbi:MAG: rhombotarget lipoprotein [Myxococcota bacterium]|nr:rhombotarget lipoprotein [Myxococcota bacterium]